ncbi:hypothetical protein DS843_29875 [Roseomonas genomospecies 6]|uniref:Uncharacterized protein n=1 Tax=Roseomonas genomospecies 6 TaxID=214106 RepID=A0A9W7KN35_9PROT|nr:hypothetical protein DS843_29875 [Roseomonas genomospecies 6]
MPMELTTGCLAAERLSVGRFRDAPAASTDRQRGGWASSHSGGVRRAAETRSGVVSRGVV